MKRLGNGVYIENTYNDGYVHFYLTESETFNYLEDGINKRKTFIKVISSSHIAMNVLGDAIAAVSHRGDTFETRKEARQLLETREPKETPDE